MNNDLDYKIGERWVRHPTLKGVKSAKLVVLFHGGIEVWSVGRHRVGM